MVNEFYYQENKMAEKSLAYRIAIPVMSFLIGYCGMETVQRKFMDNRIPNTEQVQQGYIAPSKLEVECKDLDGNGEPETIMRIGDKPYLLREVDGKPVLSAYEIKPAEVVPKSE